MNIADYIATEPNGGGEMHNVTLAWDADGVRVYIDGMRQ